jgi:hypothetical protein
MPRFIIFVRATSETETELKPDPKNLQAMGDYNATMREAGILLSADGLQPTRQNSKRIVFHGSGAPTVESGPFPVNEVVAGMWIVEVKDIDEAVSWAVKAPFKEGHVSEVRKFFEAEDLAEILATESKDN